MSDFRNKLKWFLDFRETIDKKDKEYLDSLMDDLADAETKLAYYHSIIEGH